MFRKSVDDSCVLGSCLFFVLWMERSSVELAMFASGKLELLPSLK